MLLAQHLNWNIIHTLPPSKTTLYKKHKMIMSYVDGELKQQFSGSEESFGVIREFLDKNLTQIMTALLDGQEIDLRVQNRFCQIKKRDHQRWEIIVWDHTDIFKCGRDKHVKINNIVIVFDFVLNRVLAKKSGRYVSCDPASPIFEYKYFDAHKELQQEGYCPFERMSLVPPCQVYMQPYKGENLYDELKLSSNLSDFVKEDLIRKIFQKWTECLNQYDLKIYDFKLQNILFLRSESDICFQQIELIDFSNPLSQTASKIPYSIISFLKMPPSDDCKMNSHLQNEYDEKYAKNAFLSLMIPVFVAALEILSNSKMPDGSKCCDIHQMKQREIIQTLERLKKSELLFSLLEQIEEFYFIAPKTRKKVFLKKKDLIKMAFDLIGKGDFFDLLPEDSSHFKSIRETVDKILESISQIARKSGMDSFLSRSPNTKLELLNIFYAAQNGQNLPFRIGRCEIKVSSCNDFQVIIWDEHIKDQSDEMMHYYRGGEKHIKPNHYHFLIDQRTWTLKGKINHFVTQKPVREGQEWPPRNLGEFQWIEKTGKDGRSHQVLMAPHKGLNLEYYIAKNAMQMTNEIKSDLIYKLLIANYDLLKKNGLSQVTDQKCGNVLIQIGLDGKIKEVNIIDYSTPYAETPGKVPFSVVMKFLGDKDCLEKYHSSKLKHCILILVECIEVYCSRYEKSVHHKFASDQYLSIQDIHDQVGRKEIESCFEEVIEPLIFNVVLVGKYDGLLSLEIYEEAKRLILENQ